jgi:hypothetical protein
MANPVPTFLNAFANDPKYAIPLPFLWTVTISDDNLGGNIQQALGKINHSWAPVQSTSFWSDTSNNNILVAQDIVIPGESIETVIMGPASNRGAIMPGYGASQRTDFLSRNLSINFLETDIDIETYLFRPWVVAIGVDGLIGGRLKAQTINLTQYDRKMRIRKKYVFYNAFPTNCEPVTLNYANDDLIVKSITFGYTKYDIQ